MATQKTPPSPVKAKNTAKAVAVKKPAAKKPAAKPAVKSVKVTAKKAAKNATKAKAKAVNAPSDNANLDEMFDWPQKPSVSCQRPCV